MGRVLIIASDYPPKLSIASRRPFGLSKYLQEFGWEPLVLTIREKNRSKDDCHGIQVIESDLLSKPRFIRDFLDIIYKREKTHESINNNYPERKTFYQPSSDKRWISKLRNIVFYPDRHLISWYRNAIKSYIQNAKLFPIDVIISTAKPFTTHIIARQIKVRIKVPWVADFRDLWPHYRFYNNDNDYYSPKNFLDRILVHWTLNAAEALVTVSEPLTLNLRTRFKTKKVYNIPNGFDPEEYLQKIKVNDKLFLLTYTGHVRTDCTDPESLLKAISQLICEGNINRRLIRLRFYGEITNKFLNDSTKYQLTDIIEAEGIRKPRTEIIYRQMESSILIAFSALDPDQTGNPTGKIYEYMAAKRPILAIGKPYGRDVLEEILKSTRAGVYARTFDEIKEILLLYYSQFIQKGKVEYDGFPDEIEKYNYREMAFKYAQILDEIVRS